MNKAVNSRGIEANIERCSTGWSSNTDESGGKACLGKNRLEFVKKSLYSSGFSRSCSAQDE